MTTIINPFQAVQLQSTNKTFILFNTDKNNKLTEYTLTKDLKRHRHKYDHFRLVDIFKTETKVKFI